MERGKCGADGRQARNRDGRIGKGWYEKYLRHILRHLINVR